VIPEWLLEPVKVVWYFKYTDAHKLEIFGIRWSILKGNVGEEGDFWLNENIYFRLLEKKK
jgi:hypothetical protein